MELGGSLDRREGADHVFVWTLCGFGYVDSMDPYLIVLTGVGALMALDMVFRLRDKLTHKPKRE